MAKVKGPKKTIPKERASISTAEKTIKIRLRNPHVDDSTEEEVEVSTEEEVEVSTEEKDEVEPNEKDDVEPSHEDQGQADQEKKMDGEHDLVQRPQKRRKREKLAAEEGANEGESQGPILYIDYSDNEGFKEKAEDFKRALEEAGITVYTTQVNILGSFVIRTQRGESLFMRMGMTHPFSELMDVDVAITASDVVAAMIK